MDSKNVGFWVLCAIGAVVLHWVIRTGISAGMEDFERWKDRTYREPDQEL